MALSFAGIASSQTPPTPTETPQAAPPSATDTPAQPQTTPQAPQTTPQAAPQTTPETTPSVSVPTVTVTAPPRPRTRTVRPAAPARTTTPTPPPPPSPPARTPATHARRDHPQPAGNHLPLQPAPGIAHDHHRQSDSSEPGPEFRQPVFHSARRHLSRSAPAASRPVLRGLDDFRVRVQENGIGSMDVSDHGQDHGVPIDPLSVQKVEIYRGPEALRYGSQAVGGVVEATNNRIPFAAPLGGWQTQFMGATTTVDRGLEGGALFDAGTRNPRSTPTSTDVTATIISSRAIPIFSRPTRRLLSTASSRTHRPIPKGRRWAARTCSMAAMWRPPSPVSPRFITSPRSKARRPTGASPWSRPRSPAKESFGRNRPPSTSSVSGSGRSNIATTSSDLTRQGSTGFGRRSTITRRRPRPNSSSCRCSRRSAR